MPFFWPRILSGGGGPDPSTPGTETPSPASIFVHLADVLASKPFRSAPQLSRFLKFIVDYALEGKGDELKEYLLGVEVFRRDDSFDPRIDTVVRTEARRLRQKLSEYYSGEGASDAVRIDLPKGGYCPSFQIRSSGDRPEGTPRSSVGTRISPVLAVVLVIGIVTPFAWMFVWTWIHSGNAALPARAPSVAVLPFENLSADSEQEYFSEGITDAVITSLARIKRLRVISRTSVLQFKRAKRPLAEIAAQLGTQYLVEGTVLRAGGRVRVTAQLIAALHEHHVWAESYERDLKDTLSLQADLARAIAQQIRIQISPGENSRAGVQLVNQRAYDAYLRGRFYWHTRQPNYVMKSIDCFREAITLEPGYALAYAALADSWLLVTTQNQISRRLATEYARQAARQAVALDDGLGEAHGALGALAANEWDWPEAERQFKQAVDLSPGYATGHQWYAEYLTDMARHKEATQEAELAVELDPLSPAVNSVLALILYNARDYDRAIQQFRRTLEIYPNHIPALLHLGMTFEARGMHTEAIERLEQAVALTHRAPPALSLLGYTFANAGRIPEAREILTELKSQQNTPAIVIAGVYIGLHENDSAILWLTKGYEQKSIFMEELKVNPIFDRLRGDARFTALLQKMHLVN